MTLLHQFEEHIKKEQLFAATDHLLLAVSGGIDSVVLCHLCREAGFDFSIAHCHFGLRGAESNRDATFVAELSARLGVDLYTKSFDTIQYAADRKLSVQVAARELRYQWFSQLVATNHKLKWLLTAHNANDQAETALMHFCKGTGISGLKGIPQKRGIIIRPLLFAPRTDIINFAEEKNITWVEDNSNSEIKYLRNSFRHLVFPVIEKVIEGATKNIIQTILHVEEAEVLYQQAIEVHKKKLLIYRDNELHIPVLKLMQAQPVRTILFEILKDFNFTPAQVPEVLKLLKAESGKYVSSTSHRILKNRKWLIISPLSTANQSLIIIEEGKSEVETALHKMMLQLQDAQNISIQNNAATALLDAKELRFPLIWRKWKTGDYFYPLGMKKKKKLSRFFIDQKLSLIEKEAVWVLESDKRIAWVIGYRIDDRFKITSHTKKAWQISWSSL